jgi:hypothetical protein
MTLWKREKSLTLTNPLSIRPLQLNTVSQIALLIFKFQGSIIVRRIGWLCIQRQLQQIIHFRRRQPSHNVKTYQISMNTYLTFSLSIVKKLSKKSTSDTRALGVTSLQNNLETSSQSLAPSEENNHLLLSADLAERISENRCDDHLDLSLNPLQDLNVSTFGKKGSLKSKRE